MDSLSCAELHEYTALPAGSMQVSQVVSSLSESDGGPSYSVPALAAALARAGARVGLRTVGLPQNAIARADGVDVTVHPPAGNLSGRYMRSSPGLRRSLFVDADAGAILHAHGLWLMPNIYPAWAKRGSRGAAKLVHAPRGMLA